jgi:peptide/nickel transport system permease protein
MAEIQTAEQQDRLTPDRSRWGQVIQPVKGAVRFGKRKPLGAVGGIIVLALILMAALAPIIAPYDYREAHPAVVHDPPSNAFVLGTDHLGRDVLSRVMKGAQISLYVGLGSVLIGITAAFVVSVASTYAAGLVDLSLQRLVDSLMALPGLIIALAIIAVLGASLNNVIVAIVIGMFAPVVRTVRSQVLSLKELDYVLAARAIGASSNRIVFRHIAPNCFAIYLVLATFYLGTAIILEASLSFLGVGSPPHIPSWGGMLSRAAAERLQTAPWVAIFPGLAIFVVVLGFNLLGDALRDVFDPKLRGR